MARDGPQIWVLYSVKMGPFNFIEQGLYVQGLGMSGMNNDFSKKDPDFQICQTSIQGKGQEQ